MDTSLPDEIISEILTPALRVSDDAFASTSSDTFAQFTESTSAYLVVCKAWLRVATPLLYNVVIIRSKAQANALAKALSQNPELGRFIKKLRVEGGYGGSMHTVLKASPNITDLFLSLDIWTPDTTDGLCKGLKLISPRRLILRAHEYRRKTNKALQSLVDALVAAIHTWESLTALDSATNSTDISKITTALRDVKRLQTFSASTVNEAQQLFVALNGCPLRVVNLKRRLAQYEQNMATTLFPELARLLKSPDPEPTATSQSASHSASGETILVPSLNPFFVPLKDESVDVQEAIWSRILYHALSCPERAEEPSRPTSANPQHGARVPYLQVSKMFLKCGLPHFYAHIDVRLGRQQSFEAAARNGTLEGRLLTLVFRTDTTLNVLEAMSARTTETLVACRVGLRPVHADHDSMFLSCFPSLRYLRLSGRIVLRTGCPADSLTSLSELTLSTVDSSLFSVLAELGLPSLRSLDLSWFFEDAKTSILRLQSFMETHGAKLTKLTLAVAVIDSLKGKLLEYCPNLTDLTIHSASYLGAPIPTLATFEPTTPNLALVRIKFMLEKWPRRRHERNDAIARWEALIFALNPTAHMPSLREILVYCCEWPTTERDIAKSVWVRWSEKLLRSKVDLVDADGRKWRPRLQVSRGRR
uniref:F-box domain-containing protein n=1 Tax=Mycena chlorophos TaxID=658473 RepID=A0ABQ0M1S3_MYCCL|nr:predicted protein [Mycena chlorophos]